MTDKAVSIEDWRLLSLSKVSQAWGISRDTAKRLLDATAPDGEKSGHSAWTIKTAASVIVPHVLGFDATAVDEDGNVDPAKLPPKDRKDWYDSELKRESLRVKQGELIPAEKVEADKAETFKSLATTIQTLDDVLERDLQLSPEQTQKVSAIKRRVLESLQMSIMGKV